MSMEKPDIIKHYREVKKVIRKGNLPELFTLSRYSISPYQACSHGCLYCDGRAEKYYVEGSFDRDIIIRKNVPALTALEASKLREKGIFSIGSGTTDAYQPVEKEELITRGALEVLAEYDFPVLVITKSALLLRDMDLISKIQKRNGFIVLISLTSLDEKIRDIFEPGASSFARRLEMIGILKEAGCTVGILAMPLLPFITAKEENLKNLYSVLLKMNVDFIMPGGLTLRPGKQKELYFRQIASHFPELTGSYNTIYAENRASGNMTYKYRKEQAVLLGGIQNEFSCPAFFHHALYKGKTANYDEIFILLNQMKKLYAHRGVNIGPLKKSTSFYTTFLLDLKKEFNRKRSRRGAELEVLIGTMLADGSINTIIQNEKLTAFLQKVILEGAVLNPLTARLDTPGM